MEALRQALERLLGGDFAAEVATADAQTAALFDAVRDRLQDPASAATTWRRSAREDGAPGERFVALVGPDRFAAFRSEVGGEMAGSVLDALCRRITRVVPRAWIGRIGPTTLEFAFAAADETSALAILHQLHPCLEEPVWVGGGRFDLPTSIGCARIEAGAAPGSDGTGLDNARRALTRAQATHAKCAIFRTQDQVEESGRLSLLRDLRQGLERGELSIAYQPKLCTRSNVIDSVEALVRWRHPVRGPVAPDQFIGLAENTGDIAAITRMVLSQAVRDQASMKQAGFDLSIHVNLSGALVADEAFGAWILTQCSQAPGRIGLEITETAVFADPERALRNLRGLAAAGIPIAIDDYGSGLSSLAYLKELPATELKIDRLFISGLSSSHRAPLLVRSTIDLAHALEMQVTAEGVDDAATLALLRIMGCDRAQGYLIAPALEVGALLSFLAERRGGEAMLPGRPADEAPGQAWIHYR